MVNTIFFDLDGTLLPMDQNDFVQDYFTRLVKALGSIGLHPELGKKAVGYGTKLMMDNAGPDLNEDLFWQGFSAVSNIHKEQVNDLTLNFYQSEFQEVIKSTQPIADIQDTIDLVKEKGYDLVLATNPLFPKIATHSRVKWANLKLESFSEITTFEHYHASKPHLTYYQEIMEKMNIAPENVLMVGNDVGEDLVIKELGSKTYLVTDNLINCTNKEIVTDYMGSMNEFRTFVNNLPKL